MKRKKIFSLVAIICTFVMIFSACSSSTGTGKTDNNTEKTAEESSDSNNPFAKQLEITWIGHNAIGLTPTPDTGANNTKKLIEEKFNVIIKPQPVDIFNTEQWNLFWAEGNTADFINHTAGTNIYNLVDQGLLREISEEMVRKNMPEWIKKVESMVGPEIVKQQMYYKGKVYSVPYINYSNTQSHIMAARQDWMENVGITEAPKTIDDFYVMLKKFTFDDPDKNGKDDTYGMHGTQGYNYICGAFGLHPDSYYLQDGKVVYTSTMEDYKDLLKTLNKWFMEGILDPEFVTDNRDIQRKKWSEGKFGVLRDHPWWFAKSTPGNLTQLLSEKNPDAKVLFFGNFTGPDGKSGAMVYYPNLNNQGSIFFGKNTSDEKVERIMAIKEALAADWDWFVRIYYGEKGKHYNLDKDGKIVIVPEETTPEKGMENGLGQYYGLMPIDLNDYKKFTANDDLPPYEISLANNKSYTGVAFALSGVNEAAKVKGTDVSTISNEFYFNAITGKVDIDAEWDNYIKRLNDAGLQEIIEEYNKIVIK